MTYPTAFTWDAEARVMWPKWPRLAASRFEGGRDYLLGDMEHRSDVSHRHEFAWLREAWNSLPEHLAAAFPSVEHLRKHALIASGFCNTTDYVCSSRAEAVRWAENLRRETDEYTLVEVRESIVRVHKARSQSHRAMGKVEFQASKTAILEVVSAMLGVEPATLQRQQEAA